MPPVFVSFFFGGFGRFDRLRSDEVVTSMEVMSLFSLLGEKNRGGKLGSRRNPDRVRPWTPVRRVVRCPSFPTFRPLPPRHSPGRSGPSFSLKRQQTAQRNDQRTNEGVLTCGTDDFTFSVTW